MFKRLLKIANQRQVTLALAVKLSLFLVSEVFLDQGMYEQWWIQPLERGGGGQIVNQWWGFQGLQGGSTPLRREILNFWTQFARFGAYYLSTSYWKSLDLFPIKVFFFLLNYGIGLYKNGSFIVFTLVPPRVPQGVLFRPIYYFLQVRKFVNRSCNIQGQLLVQLWGSKQKRGSRGRSPLVGVRGQSPLKLMLFRG